MIDDTAALPIEVEQPATGGEPDVLQQTLELARVLMQISSRDPEGRPSAAAASVFRAWLSVARGYTEEPQYFDDVAENYDVEGRSNKDLFDLFEMLHPYVEMPYVEEDEDEGGGDMLTRALQDDSVGAPAVRERKFISLPTI